MQALALTTVTNWLVNYYLKMIDCKERNAQGESLLEKIENYIGSEFSSKTMKFTTWFKAKVSDSSKDTHLNSRRIASSNLRNREIFAILHH